MSAGECYCCSCASKSAGAYLALLLFPSAATYSAALCSGTPPSVTWSAISYPSNQQHRILHGAIVPLMMEDITLQRFPFPSLSPTP
ncbi:uncharacterized protein BKA78DRAFT_318013 [Phyllosticta capitalensis]|uniref:Secreted protein n=1 Tax=Phyllosticta capitalensis TaxID=121624 RepID=A0ABR1YLV5_9PEZI